MGGGLERDVASHKNAVPEMMDHFSRDRGSAQYSDRARAIGAHSGQHRLASHPAKG